MTPADVIAAARQVMRGPLVRARSDCLSDVAALSRILWGRDMLPGGMPVYATEGEALAIAEAQGGLLAATDAALVSAGMRRVDCPAVGDVALVRVPCVLGATFAMSLGRGFVTRGARGPAVIRGEAVGAWSWA